MTSSSMTKLLSAIATTAAIALCAPAYAQKQAVNLPQGLKWEKMPYVAFNSPMTPENATSSKLREEAKTIWFKELDALPTSSFPKVVNGKVVGGKETRKFPAFILMGTHESNDTSYVFSILEAGRYDGCILEGNYTSCTLRMVVKDKKTGKAHQQDYPSFCSIPFSDDEKNNRTEIAVDSKSQTVYFRTISHGDVVPECVKLIHLK